MKTLKPIAVAVLAALSPAAHAQWYPTTLNVTNHVPSESTTTVSGVIDATQAEHFALQARGRLTGAGTSAITLTIQNSVNGVDWNTAFTIALTASGTNFVSVLTNVNAQAIPWWRLRQIANANSAALTNFSIVAGVKHGIRSFVP